VFSRNSAGSTLEAANSVCGNSPQGHQEEFALTKAEVQTILNTIAEEFEAVDQADLARAYRRAAGLVEAIEEGPRRRRRRTVRAAAAAAPAAAAGGRRRGRPPRSASAD